LVGFGGRVYPERFRIGVKLRTYLKLINPFISNGLISKQPPTGLKAAVGGYYKYFYNLKKGRQTLFRFFIGMKTLSADRQARQRFS
jgi:hypothetical protein